MLTNDERCRNNLIHNNYIICQKKKQILSNTEDKHTYKSKETKNRKAKELTILITRSSESTRLQTQIEKKKK